MSKEIEKNKEVLERLFAEGDYFELNRKIKEMMEGEDDELKKVAEEYKRKISIDPVTIAVAVITFLVFFYIVFKYVF